MSQSPQNSPEFESRVDRLLLNQGSCIGLACTDCPSMILTDRCNDADDLYKILVKYRQESEGVKDGQ